MIDEEDVTAQLLRLAGAPPDPPADRAERVRQTVHREWPARPPPTNNSPGQRGRRNRDACRRGVAHDRSADDASSLHDSASARARHCCR